MPSKGARDSEIIDGLLASAMRASETATACLASSILALRLSAEMADHYPGFLALNSGLSQFARALELNV